MRLIDADEAKKKMIYYGFTSPDMTATEFIEDECETIDAVPVVRCKDCIHFNKKEKTCSMLGQDEDMVTAPNEYCSWGMKNEIDKR